MIRKILIALVTAKLIAVVYILSPHIAGLPGAFAQEGGRETQETVSMELIEDIRKRQEELAQKEEELNRREDRIRTLEINIDKKIDELKRLQVRLDDLIKLRGDVEDRNASNLAKAYSSMAPEEAAARLEKMERKIALTIMEKMKSKQSAKIFAAMSTELATEISEQLAKRPLK